VNSLYLYALTLTGTGLTLLLIPVFKSYLGLQVLSAMVGFFSGNWSITSYITTKIVGMERLSHAHGILMCFGGFGITLGPPVVGKKSHLINSKWSDISQQGIFKQPCSFTDVVSIFFCL